MGMLNENILSATQLLSLSTIVQVGESAYRDLSEAESSFLRHPYSAEMRGRIRTKLVQMQCEIESHNPNFPFEFAQRTFRFEQCIPELRTNNIILHIARSNAPTALPYASRYKVDLSANNKPLQRQVVLELDNPEPVFAPFYGVLVFGGRDETFMRINFPAPGFDDIADSIPVQQVQPSTSISVQRKTAKLKAQFLAHAEKEGIS